MQETLELDRLSLNHYRQIGVVPSDTPELRRRIQDHGIIDPVIVRPFASQPGRFEIIFNAATYIAAGKLGRERVPVVIRDDLDDEEAEEIVRAQYRSVTGNPIDEAEWFDEQLNQQFEVHGRKPTIARLARLIGKSRSHVSRSLALLTLPNDVQKLFRRGELSAAHGRFLVKLKSTGQQKKLASRAAKQNLSVRDLEAIVNGKTDTIDATPAATPTKDPDTLRLEQKLTGLLGSPVSIDHAAGILQVQYFGNFEMLEGILSKMGYREDS